MRPFMRRLGGIRTLFAETTLMGRLSIARVGTAAATGLRKRESDANNGTQGRIANSRTIQVLPRPCQLAAGCEVRDRARPATPAAGLFLDANEMDLVSSMTSPRPFPAGRMIGMTVVGATL